MPLTKPEAERLAMICVEQDVTSVKMEEVTSLWGGMGRIYRITATTPPESSSAEFVVKYIDHLSKACRLSTSDKRKLIESYENEARFYQLHSEDLRTNHGMGLCQSLHVEPSDSTTGSGTNNTITCLSVLQSVPSSISTSHKMQLTVEWLATFHSATWQRPSSQLGSFWHYETRPSMWKTLSGQGLEGRLKRAARSVDEWLRHETRLQSWIHGDCKEDNVLWDVTKNKLALCDFQYVGQGCPCRDLAYFLSTRGVVSDDATHDSLVDVYYKALSSKLTALSSFSLSSSSISAPIQRSELHVALDLAYCDYMRFLCAWRAPLHTQQKEGLASRVQRILDRIDGGTDLGSEEAYRGALVEFAASEGCEDG